MAEGGTQGVCRAEGEAEDGSPAECDPEDESPAEGEASSGRRIVGAEKISASEAGWQGSVAGRRRSASQGGVARRCSRAASQGQTAQGRASQGRCPRRRQGGRAASQNVAGRLRRAAS